MSIDLITLNGPTMGTRWTLRLAPPAGLDLGALTDACAAAMARIEAQMSTWQPGSDLMRFNAAAVGEWQALPADLLVVLAAGLQIGRDSDGVFDIGVGALVRAWGFGPAQGRADPARIKALIGQRLATASALELDMAGGRARKLAAVDLDLSGIAKGFAADVLAGVAQGFGLTDVLAGLDGEVVARGHRPDGRPWAVALEEPLRGSRTVRGVIELTDRAVATSGDYRHFVQVGAGYLAHSMNPRLGGPAQNRLASVSVLAENCMTADAWATVLLVLGEDAGPALARARGIEAIFLVRDGAVLAEIVT
ncbi:FAD:protein FMN transferase [Rhodobacter ferrooxidans]|uniref:FAD:protein FMN transferase n=1 Tax=Rhodobacter ferrooxidans TaxID=371731 RepID=C8RZQ2_9RHOB|nr:FAD:protein FMN transferase [Rhodobacter sp. SW2]EEW25849.1 ApbE family lipoprotein [Rhodobacter sp. SW2]